MQSRAVTLRPSGPLGGVMVRLKPEAAVRIAGSTVDEFRDAAFSLCDVFSPTEVSLLDEMLAEAPDAVARVTAVQAFLLRRMRDDGPDPLVCQAARWLRRDPTLSVRHLASRLDISERHLSRRFQATIGATPKQFARIVRIGKVVATARQHRTGWVDIAQSCGFNDQAHMINDFNAMVGSPPQTFFRATSLGDGRKPSASRAESDFYNTFVVEPRSAQSSRVD
ncbi:MAG: helix-turn-helix domain-containing protein [Xanthobacteraceae bacterium]